MIIACPGCGELLLSVDLINGCCPNCGDLVVPPRFNVEQFLRCMAHPRSNIAAVHFDGPWLAECLRLHAEIERMAGDKQREPWRG